MPECKLVFGNTNNTHVVEVVALLLFTCVLCIPKRKKFGKQQQQQQQQQQRREGGGGKVERVIPQNDPMFWMVSYHAFPSPLPSDLTD